MDATIVTATGDVNHDGLADLVISAPGGTQIGLPGTVYVVFGGSDAMRSGFVDLATLTAPDGFTMDGSGPGAEFGRSLTAGFDFNADGVDDLAIAERGSSLGRLGNGVIYIIFGRAGLGADGRFDLTSLDGSNGFVIHGPSSDSRLGHDYYARLGVLDYNTDGYPDLLAPAAGVGRAYVIFGGPTVGASGSIDLAAWDDSMGIRFRGSAAPGGGAVGLTSVPGDVNGDGIDDVMFGAPTHDIPGVVDAGTTYVVFGGTLPDEDGFIDLTPALGNRALIIYGPYENALMGYSWYAGDVNGDGYADVVLDSTTTIISYLVFGGEHANHVGIVDLADADGTYAARIDNRNVRGAGDIDGDGFCDLVDGHLPFFTAPADPPRGGAGVEYVAYGHAGIGRTGAFTISANPAPDEGFVIWGAHEGDGIVPRSVLPDVNGDGVDELVISALDLQRPDGTVGGGGYVIYGQRRFALGDFDRDRDVDMADFFDFVMCYNGPSRPPAGSCPQGVLADFDADGDVDLSDYATFAQNYTGAR